MSGLAFFSILLGVATVGALLLLSPVLMIRREINGGSRFAVIPMLVVQLLPSAVAIGFWQYSVTHMRIPVFGYLRPEPMQVLAATAIFQAAVSGLLLAALRQPIWRALVCTALSVLGIFVVVFVGIGVVECMNGNCL